MTLEVIKGHLKKNRVKMLGLKFSGIEIVFSCKNYYYQRLLDDRISDICNSYNIDIIYKKMKFVASKLKVISHIL